MSLDLTVSAPQSIFLSGLDTRFKAFVGGFGSGKTFVGCLDALLFAGRNPGYAQGYFAPTYGDIRKTYWPTLGEAAALLGFSVKYRKTDKEADLYRGRSYYGTIICVTMDDPSAIVGFKIARAHVDEIDLLPTIKAREAWQKIVARMRLEVPGVENGIGVTTTPEGFRFVYEQFATSANPIYSMVQASTYENQRFLPSGYIQSMLDTYPEELIKAYLNGDFVNLTSGSVYPCFSRINCGSTEVIAKDDDILAGMDFNVGKMAVKFAVWRNATMHFVDEITEGRDTPTVIETIKGRYPGRNITIYPDASGAAGSSRSASESDIALLKVAGFNVKHNPANPKVKDRVISVNAAFERGRLFVNPSKCPVLTKCLEQQAYDRNGDPDKSAGHDHSNDAAGYLVTYEMPVRKPDVSTFRVNL